MTNRKLVGAPFLAIGIAFLAIGASGNRAFIAIGIAFMALGALEMVRR